MHWALGLLILSLLGLHQRNRGRSGPIAALLFVAFGPALGVGLMVGWLFAQTGGDTGRGELYGLDVAVFSELMLLIGVAAAVLGAAVHGYLIRDELRAYREMGAPGWLGRLRTGMGPAPALTALGLPPTASLEEIDRAYREHVKQVHPDLGGNAEQFKRLQKVYEQAKRQARPRSTRGGATPTAGRGPQTAGTPPEP